MSDTETHQASCPLGPVDKRLGDVHQQWHHAERAYFDPEPFRLAIQTAIQTLRTVTFVLQNHQRSIPDFDAWYGDWQERLRRDSLMRWMVDARNKIEKQGDLEMHSFVRAEIIASYLNEGPAIEVPARLFDDPLKLLRSIPKTDLGEHIRKNGALRIHRRWVENSLPDSELLEAVAIAYGRISQVVSDAHRQMGLIEPVTTDTGSGQRYDAGRDGRLPCMIGHAEARSLYLSLADGQPIEFERKSVDLDRARVAKVAEHYGDVHKDMFDGANEEEIATNLFRTATKVFLKDGYHISIFFLFRERRLVQMMEMRSEDQSQKYILMRAVANEVTKYGADAVMALGEVWTAPADSLNPYQRAMESHAREEALTATLVTKVGVPIQWSARIIRDGGQLNLGETRVARDIALFSFAPVYEQWGKPIPAAWLRAVETTLRGARGDAAK